MIDLLRRDLALAIRTHAKTPLVTGLAVGVLALGIAAASVSVSVVNALFVRQLPIAATERFVHVYRLSAASEPFPISYPEYEDVRALSRVFDGAVAESPAPLIFRAAGGPAERVWGEIVSDDYFAQLGVTAVHGRVFTAADDAVVLSDAFWRRRFGAATAVIGATLEIEGRPYRVTGVAPRGFHGTIVGFSADLWLPLRSASSRSADSLMRDDAERRDERNYFVMARLAPGIRLEQARTALMTLAGRLGRDAAATSNSPRLTALKQADGRFLTVRESVFGFSMLTVVIAVLVTVIACANIAGVLLVRAAARRGEIGVRLALGASRRRIVSQLLAESTAIAVPAGALGITIAWQAAALLSRVEVPIARGASAGVDVALDGGVLAASVLLTLAAGVLCGLTPALDALKTDVIDSLRHGRAGRGGGASRSRRVLLAAQVATSMVLLAGGGLLLRSFDAARQTDLGFSPDGVVTAAVDVRPQPLRREPDNPFWTTLLDRIRALPGTDEAALTFRLPLELGLTREALAPYPFTPVPGLDWPEVEFSVVSPGYFSTLRIPLLEGRDFDEGDAGSAARVVIVNDVIAARFWPRTNAVGRLMTNPDGDRIEVIGVASRAKYFSIGEPPTAYAYFPMRQHSPQTLTVTARTRGDRRAYAEEVRSAIRGMDQQATVDVALLSDRVRLALMPAAGSAAAIAVVTLLALALTGLGLFGAVAQTVGRRTYEIGVRRALGAPDSRIASLVIGDTFVLVLSGLGAGLIAAAIVAQPLRAVLYDIDVADPLVFAAASAALLMTCLLAICLPTWRALRVTAAEALRHE